MAGYRSLAGVNLKMGGLQMDSLSSEDLKEEKMIIASQVDYSS
jgi:hypothetical protein